MAKPVVGIIGASQRDAFAESDKPRLRALAEELATALSRRDCVVVTGATTGLPYLVSLAFRGRSGFALGVSPAATAREHVEDYALPLDGSDVIVYTGFGLKGRNVITVRSADIVILIGGATGTLNEFTIAYDEGKIIGVLEGTGGVADHIGEIIDCCNKPTQGLVLFANNAEDLIHRCFEAFRQRC